MKISDFKLANVYRRDDLISAFGGSFMRGMNKCNRTNTLVLISKHTRNRIYDDQLFEGNRIIYTGEGREGDQKMQGANKDLRDANENNLPVYLFVVFNDGEYTYYGKVRVSGDIYLADELDVNGNYRKVFKFPLIRESNYIPMTQEEIATTFVGGIVPFDKPLIEVVGAVIVDGNKVLCARRGHGALIGKYEFPGGKINENETDQEALRREIKEELNIDIDVSDFVDDCRYDYGDRIVHLKAYKCIYLSGVIHSEEHQSVDWVDNDKLSALDWAPADKPILETYLDSLPKTIVGTVSFDYFEAEAVKPSEKETLRAVQNYERSNRNKAKAGAEAELAVIGYERDKLNNLGRPDLADAIKQVSEISSDYGYDVHSYELSDGHINDLHIEVKSASLSGKYIEFFISQNELDKFKTDVCYRIYCLIKSGRKNYQLHVVKKTDFFNNDYLSPLTYRVRIRIAE